MADRPSLFGQTDEGLKGPILGWPFPLLNALRKVFSRIGKKSSGSTGKLHNQEEVEWTDWKGRKRAMKIKRQVKAGDE